MDYIERLNEVETCINDKLKRQLSLDSLRRLILKLSASEIDELSEQLKRLFDELESVVAMEKPKIKSYLKALNNVKKIVKDTYGYVAEGTIVGEYMAYGVAIGLMLGAAFTTLNTAFIAIGLPIGIAIGLSLGNSKESTLKKEGKIY